MKIGIDPDGSISSGLSFKISTIRSTMSRWNLAMKLATVSEDSDGKVWNQENIFWQIIFIYLNTLSLWKSKDAAMEKYRTEIQ